MMRAPQMLAQDTAALADHARVVIAMILSVLATFSSLACVGVFLSFCVSLAEQLWKHGGLVFFYWLWLVLGRECRLPCKLRGRHAVACQGSHAAVWHSLHPGSPHYSGSSGTWLHLVERLWLPPCWERSQSVALCHHQGRRSHQTASCCS